MGWLFMKEHKYIEDSRKYIEFLSQEYRERIELLFEDSYKNNPEAFPLADLSQIDIYIVTCNDTVISHKFYILVYQGSGKTEFIGHIPDDEYKNLRLYSNSDEFIKAYVEEKTKNKSFYFLDSILNVYFKNALLYQDIDSYLERNKSVIGRRSLLQVKKDGDKFVNHINRPASYYSKDAYKYVYTDLDFRGIIQMVNDPDFEYALNESIECYENSFYLAAVSTAGTALESLMLRILSFKGHDPDSLPEKTELGELSGILRGKGIINRRDRNRIMTAASIRNSASHANKGRVIREDAKLIYQAIFNLATQVFESKSE